VLAGPARRREVPVEIHAARVLLRAGVEAVGVRDGNDPGLARQRTARIELVYLVYEPLQELGAEGLVAVDGAEEEDGRSGAFEAARQDRSPEDREADGVLLKGAQASSDLPRTVARP
jgi:hypothetical protein